MDRPAAAEKRPMMLSSHFALVEFTVSRTASMQGIDNTPSDDIIEALCETAGLLEEVRSLLGAPILITSGYRCPALNAAINGAPNSAHMAGRAADFICPGFGTAREVCHRIANSGIDYDQLILEWGEWTHIAWAEEPRLADLTIDRAGTRTGIA